MDRPTFQDVLEARAIVSRYVQRTPLHYYPALSRLVGAEVRLKHENHHALGAFKVRGGVNLLAHMPEEERKRGLVTASTGNHGQSIAYACRLFGARAVVVLPKNANSLKVQAMRDLGAELVFHGKVFEEARRHAEALAREQGCRYVHPANEPLLIAGVATETLEIIEDFPQVEVIFVPLGGGSGAAGACIVAKALNPAIQVIAVQSEQAPAAYRSWKERRLVEGPMSTFADGLATSQAYELTQAILWDLLDDFLLVSDAEIRQAIGVLIEKAHTLAEGAGAAAVAGALKSREAVRGRRVAIVVSGGNITLEHLREALAAYRPE